MSATRDERVSSRVFNSDVVFCSKAKAFLYVDFRRRNPDEQKTEVQKFPPLSVIGVTGVDSLLERCPQRRHFAQQLRSVVCKGRICKFL